MRVVTSQTSLFGSGINRITDDTGIRRGKMAVPNHIRGWSRPSCRISGPMKRHFTGIQQIAVSRAGRIKGSGKKNLMAGGAEIKLPRILKHGQTVFHCSGWRSAETAVMAVMTGPALNGGAFRQPFNPDKKSGQLPAVHTGGFSAILAENFITVAAGAKGKGDCNRGVGMGALLVCGKNIGRNSGGVPSDSGRQGPVALAADVEIRHWIRMIRDNRQVKRTGAMTIFATNRRHPPGWKLEIGKPGG